MPDIAIVGVFGLSMLIGLMRGFVVEVMSIIVWDSGIFSSAGVTVTPARMAFAVTPVPCRASSIASCRMWDSRAALADDTTP